MNLLSTPIIFVSVPSFPSIVYSFYSIQLAQYPHTLCFFLLYQKLLLEKDRKPLMDISFNPTDVMNKFYYHYFTDNKTVPYRV